ncbi:MAG: Gfo/Idh/MocA family oxidoreductase [Deltaproteobacteria bacterium]|nr:Gfo/Idh/MocA family oxidoreductase [Deltaproteobacteria bacterium]
MGLRHLSLLKEIKGVMPIAIPKRNDRRVELNSQGFQTAASLKQAAEEGTNLAIIASNTGQHAADALEALECGMDLLVEKPLSVDAESARSVYEGSKRRNKKLFVGCVLRCSTSLQTFREWLPRIGKVYAVTVECQSFLPTWRPNHPYRQSYSAKTEEGGVLRDLIHEIDYATWIFGFPEKIQAHLKNTGRLSIEAEEFARLWWETKGGVSVSVCLDYLSKIPRRHVTAFGEKGNLEWDGLVRKTSVAISDYPKEERVEPDLSAIYKTQLEEWLEACRTQNRATWLATGLEGIRVLSICDAARLASETRREETVSYLHG